jgi:glutamate decarboxylase
MVLKYKTAQASLDNLLRIFTVPEGPDSTLTRIEEEISRNLNQFLREHIVSEEKPLKVIEQDFLSSQIPDEPCFVSEHTQHLLEKVVSQSVHTAAPSFIGHMTSALPYFLMPMSKIMFALNQNLVKIETSKAFTPLERQVLGMLHRLIYTQEEAFYHHWMHSANHSLGAFCSGGTIANITALWVARNNALKATGTFKGIGKEGLFKAMQYYDYAGLAILVSERGHYSLKKAADLLGIGQTGLIAIPTDHQNKLDIKALKSTITDLKKRKIKPIAVVGVAGTTETGNVDPLTEIAQICQAEQCHFHVDAAWGGATLMSKRYRTLLRGIEKADSVTIDAHKQFYLPMGAGMVLFKNPTSTNVIEHHAQYILREGSKDLGSRTLEGSRAGMALLMYASLNIIGRTGYGLLIDESIAKATFFADLIRRQSDFELISQPELCLLTYRYIPPQARLALQQGNPAQVMALNHQLNALTKFIQKKQREAGKSFVSRTQLNPYQFGGIDTIVFRVVLANPLTSKDILCAILDEQRQIAEQTASDLLDQIQETTKVVLKAD